MRAEALEQRFNDSQSHAKRLLKELDGAKRQVKAHEKEIKGLKGDNERLKGKLDNLWVK